MTKQEYIEQLQDSVETNKITNETDLPTQFINEDGTTEPIEIYDEVLSPIEYNICDRCGALKRTDEGEIGEEDKINALEKAKKVFAYVLTGEGGQDKAIDNIREVIKFINR